MGLQGGGYQDHYYWFGSGETVTKEMTLSNSKILHNEIASRLDIGSLQQVLDFHILCI